LDVQGQIPSYVKGSLMRNGGGIWSAAPGTADGSSASSYTHIFDGLAKVSAWRIHNDGVVQYRNQFIQSNMYERTMREGKLPITISIGPVQPAPTTVLGQWQRLIQAIFNSPGMDNAPVNLWDYDPENQYHSHHDKKRITARSDVPARAVLSLADLSTLSTVGTIGGPVIGLNGGLVILETAHPLYEISFSESSNDVATYDVATVFVNGRLEVAVIRELPNGTRTVVASHPPQQQQNGLPYLHSFGLTERYVICIIQPLRLNPLDIATALERGFLRTLQPVPRTEVMVFDLRPNDDDQIKTGEERNAKLVFHESTDEKVFFYHSVSASSATTGDSGGGTAVSVRLCAYRTADMITGEHHFLRVDEARQGGAAYRNQIPRGGTFCDITAHLGGDDTTTTTKPRLTVEWMDEIVQGFELPTTRYSRIYRHDNGVSSSSSLGGGGPSEVGKNVSRGHPRYVYAYGAYANGSPNYDDWGIYKFDLHRRTVAASFVRPLLFPSEPIFVPNPAVSADGRHEEDDGVVLVQMYDGSRKETGLFVLDGMSLQVVATVWSKGHRSPMDFHGAWIPSTTTKQQ
jgi:carotenoid cleavage dioxygenase-like enzyme